MLALGLRPCPIADLEAAVVSVRRLWRGVHVAEEAGSFSLHDAHLHFPARPDIPVFIAASGPRSLELAGRIGDGVISLVGLSPETVAWASEHIDRGFRDREQGERAETGTARPHLGVFAYGAIAEDREEALESARPIAAWFPQTAPVVSRLAGLPDGVIDEVRSTYTGGEFQEATSAAKLIPDAFVRTMALAGNEADARERIEAVLGAGADSIHVFPLGQRRMETVRAFARCWRDVTGPS